MKVFFVLLTKSLPSLSDPLSPSCCCLVCSYRGDSDGGLLAVLAADLTLQSLKALVEDAMPLCSDDKYELVSSLT